MIQMLMLSVILLCSLVARSQTQASCGFLTLLPTKVNIPGSGAVNWSPAGINDQNTVVGSASTATADYGIIRWAQGGVTSIFATSLVARNDNGISIGYSPIENNQPILVSGNGSAGETLLELNGGPFLNVTQFTVSGINVWSSIVGSVPSSSSTQGFKLWSNGGVLAIKYPAATSTTPSGLNDSGTIVGSYSTGGKQQNGFIYQNGQWATLNFPNATSTTLTGISNSGMIIGNAQVNGSSTAFIYWKGAFKTISVPNAASGSVRLLSISARIRVILGTAGLSGGTTGFVTRCQ
jgi:hypothetical protein